jgi:hypothetical protein
MIHSGIGIRDRMSRFAMQSIAAFKNKRTGGTFVLELE